MGQAKRRAAARELKTEAMNQVDLPRLAAAMRNLAIAASGQIGDCYIHASIAQQSSQSSGLKRRL